ncbi:putative bifunctional diguanylate cyclase/phosphodiesterase [Actimicrobium antarcticum]|uniref:putative bifunctional diguanylate cyclase/phosphodiesterase n=1 Tax=Actimicrobium antarcticum TaxID=1051899 RepID=UPI0031D7E0C0
MPAAATATGTRGIRIKRFLRTNMVGVLLWSSLLGLLIAFLIAERQQLSLSENNMAVIIFATFGALWLWSHMAWRQHQQVETRESYRIATEGGLDGISILNAIYDRRGDAVDFIVSDCNERGAAFDGMNAEQLKGMRLSRLYSKPQFRIMLETLRCALQNGYHEDEVMLPIDGRATPVWIYRRLVRTDAGIAITMRDISDKKMHEHELWRLANEDALTTLPNRNWLTGFLPAAFNRAKQDGSKLALLFIDLDDFKDVNDSMGHSAGDELLRIAALRLQAALRPGDHIARLGGDEFTVILAPIADRAAVAQVAQRISDAFAKPFDMSHGSNTVGISIGISLFPDDGDDGEEILKNSDLAMYYAKTAGKHRFQFYEPRMSDSLKARLDMARALQHAIEYDEFVVYYQPRVNTSTGELVSLEALVRWLHPQRGLVPPLEFIPLAEETRLILPMGELIVAHVCRQLSLWKEAGLPVVPISVNVSPRQFNHGNIKALFATRMLQYQIESGLIEIEITESSMMGEQEEISSELRSIRALGIKLLVDDFGTGYSSLSQLQRLAMDVLKVDRAFTSELGKSEEGEVFFRAILSMAHALGMTVVAEGVETATQLRILQSLDCDEIQGYFIARPLPPAEIPRILQKRFLIDMPRQIVFPLEMQ